MIFRWFAKPISGNGYVAAEEIWFGPFSPQNLWSRGKFKYCTSLTDIPSREEALILEQTEFLSDALKCEEEQAKEIVNRNIYLLVKNKKLIQEKAQFVRNLFTLEDITEHSEVLTLPLGPVKQQYYTMKEFGLKNITCSTLLNYKNVIRKTPTELIDDDHLETTSDPLQDVLVVLKNPEFAELMTEEIKRERYMENPLIGLKRVLLPRYLAHLFGTSIDNARLTIRVHHQLLGTCFTDVVHCLTVLQDIYKFPIQKIRVNPYLLHGEPSNLYKIAALPSLMGGNTLDIAQKFPKVISRPVENLLEIESILRQRGVTDDVLQESRYLFLLSPETVRDIIIKRKLKKMLGR